MGALIATLTKNRKNAMCPACRRVLAYRTRQHDGSHLLFVDRDWRWQGGISVRNWRRWEASGVRHRGTWLADVPAFLRAVGTADPLRAPRTLRCGCGGLVTLTAAALDVSFDAAASWTLIAPPPLDD